MAGYNMIIRNNDEMIELSTKEHKSDITGVQFGMNTKDNSSRNRADAIRNEIIIKGTITLSNRDITKRLAKWSMDSNRKTLYRDVEIVVYNSENCSGDVLRRYESSGMFVVDYKEIFSVNEPNSNAECGTYELFIAQREDDERKEVFSS